MWVTRSCGWLTTPGGTNPSVERRPLDWACRSLEREFAELIYGRSTDRNSTRPECKRIRDPAAQPLSDTLHIPVAARPSIPEMRGFGSRMQVARCPATMQGADSKEIRHGRHDPAT